MTLKKLFNTEHERVRIAATEGRELPAGSASPVTDAEYKNECGALPPSAFENLDFEGMVPSDFKMYWPDGTICCLAVLPFNDGGFGMDEMKNEKKWKDFLDNKRFLRLFMVMPLTKLTSGFGNSGERAGKYYELLPDVLKKDVNKGGCSFSVRYDNPSDSKIVKDRQWFIAQCDKALSNLKEFLGA